jgi:hypothetical protein
MTTNHTLITLDQFVQAVSSIVVNSEGQMDKAMDDLDDPTCWDNPRRPDMCVPINEPENRLG